MFNDTTCKLLRNTTKQAKLYIVIGNIMYARVRNLP